MNIMYYINVTTKHLKNGLITNKTKDLIYRLCLQVIKKTPKYPCKTTNIMQIEWKTNINYNELSI